MAPHEPGAEDRLQNFSEGALQLFYIYGESDMVSFLTEIEWYQKTTLALL